MNKLIKQEGSIGILETPMYPARYYVGYIVNFGTGWVPRYTGNGYVRTLKEAEIRFEYLKKLK